MHKAIRKAITNALISDGGSYGVWTMRYTVWRLTDRLSSRRRECMSCRDSRGQRPLRPSFCLLIGWPTSLLLPLRMALAKHVYITSPARPSCSIDVQEDAW